MSPSLSIESEWIDQPSAVDSLEPDVGRLAPLRRGQGATRVWDRTSHAERVTIFVPAFPLARWIVQHWWALLYEPSPGENLRPAGGPHTPSQPPGSVGIVSALRVGIAPPPGHFSSATAQGCASIGLPTTVARIRTCRRNSPRVDSSISLEKPSRRVCTASSARSCTASTGTTTLVRLDSGKTGPQSRRPIGMKRNSAVRRAVWESIRTRRTSGPWADRFS